MRVNHATGRTYDFPQVLEITYDAETKTAVFCDKSRGITGKVTFALPVSESSLGARTLAKYDAGEYDWHPTQWD
jgi:hypothetical protein